MSLLLPIVIAAMPMTSNHVCWMVMNGQTVNLGYLCGEVQPSTLQSSTLAVPGQRLNVAAASAEEAFLADLSNSLSPLSAEVFAEFDSVAFARDYCSARQEGMSEAEYSGYFQYGVSMGLGEDSLSPVEAELAQTMVDEYYTAVTNNAPRHFCPDIEP